MNLISSHFGIALLAIMASGYTLNKAYKRIQLSKAKHRSIRGHAKMSRLIAKLLPFYEFDEEQFFKSDGAPNDIASLRIKGFQRLEQYFKDNFSQSISLTSDAAKGLSDLQFTGLYRVPFQYSRYVNKHLKSGSFLKSSNGTKVTDLDGNEFYDLTGSYGVNVFGYDFYKECVDKGIKKTRELGPVLGAYHPLVADNILRLKEISGMDEVSFHMSGTEAVMQAVRLARYHTGKQKLVRFCGAYHGWWDDVQPGVGNPHAVQDTYTLKEMDMQTLRVLRSRKDIACVLINPLQALHPNANAPGDSMLLGSDRSASFDRDSYSKWLKNLREVCSDRGIALILDEVFVGFRIAYKGAQEYFGVSADLVCYGKTLGGGLPVGVLCGKHRLMKRFRDDKPADICFARGTFNSHPYVMAAMNEFLERLETKEIREKYEGLDRIWNERARILNKRLVEKNLPVQVSNLSSIWTVSYTEPSRYNWMFQYYLKAEGLALSWVGTGRLIFSLNFSDQDFNAVLKCFVSAAEKMQEDGWWWKNPEMSNKTIKRSILRELFNAWWQSLKAA
jgi:glutamate-1-semialdehyde 2,1-aminomutase